jgi:hypothetical protein
VVYPAFSGFESTGKVQVKPAHIIDSADITAAESTGDNDFTKSETHFNFTGQC